MKKFPLLASFENEEPIGWVEINEDMIPSTPNWHISIGYMRKDIGNNEYELVCFGLVPDVKFKAYEPT